MKSQTKIILIAIFTAAIALTAVGATYSWFSDTEKTAVDVSTGTVDVSYEASDLKMYSWNSSSTAEDKMDEVTDRFTCGGTAVLSYTDSMITITLKNMAPGDRITFNLSAFNESTLNTIYRTLLEISGERGDLKIQTKDVDGASYIDINPGASEWINAPGVTGKTQLGTTQNILLEIPYASTKAVSCSVVFTLEAVQSNADPYTYIYTVDQLYAFANDVNVAGNQYKDKTVYLCADLDLNGAEWTPISGVPTDYSAYGPYKPFLGTFDGQGHTISNFNVSAEKDAGFFGDFGGVVKDLKIDNETIVTTYNAGCIAASLYYGKILDCEVTNSSIISTPALQADGNYDNANNVGGIVGLLNAGTVDGCKISSTTITAYRSFGGIAGTGTGSATSTATISNCTVDDSVKLYQTLEHDYKNLGTTIADEHWGRIVSDRSPYYTSTNNTPDNTIKTNKPEVINTERIISTVDELKAFAYEVNSGCTFIGKTVKLAADIDLGYAEWTPITGKEAGNIYVGFQGTFDGQNHTVKNFKVTEVNHCAGFFGQVSGAAVVKNLTIDNATVYSNHYSGGIVGHLNFGTISNCTVKNSDIKATIEELSAGWDNGDKVGGIAGFAQGTIENCTVMDTTLTAYRDVGGIAGAAGTPTTAQPVKLTISGCTVNTVSIIQDLTNDTKNIDNNGVTSNGAGYKTYGYIISERNVITPTSCTESGNTFKQINRS